MGIYKFGNNTYPQRIRCRSNLGHIFLGKKVRFIGQEIWFYILTHSSFCVLNFMLPTGRTVFVKVAHIT